MMRHSLYWDDFEERAKLTAECIKEGKKVPVRRVACFISGRCNFNCSYCKNRGKFSAVHPEEFKRILERHPSAIFHITGGEPSTAYWLYEHLTKTAKDYTYHLNTNCYIEPPAKAVKRVKVSLDSHKKWKWNELVGAHAFDRVVKNIKKIIPETVVSITCTLTHENINDTPDFIKFCNKEFPGLYALFFSVYKGEYERFVITKEDADNFFNTIRPQMEELLDEESLALLNETIDEKRRLMQGTRFVKNNTGTCYLSLSERVYTYSRESACSHLFRDGIPSEPGVKNKQCTYGCNQRLVAFNKYVEELLND